MGSVLREAINYSLIVEIRPTFGGLTPHLCPNNPCFGIMVVESSKQMSVTAISSVGAKNEHRDDTQTETDELRAETEAELRLAELAKVYDVEGLRQKVIDFFISYQRKQMETF